MPVPLKSRANLLVLIVLSVGVWSLASPQEVTHQQFTKRLVAAAIERTHHPARYVPDYVDVNLAVTLVDARKGTEGARLRKRVYANHPRDYDSPVVHLAL